MVDVCGIEWMLDARTVDAFQGRERDVIIFNTVATWPHKALQDYRRLNVAITRAKKKLVIVGSSEVCQHGLPHFYDFFRFVEKNGIIASSPSETDLELHAVRGDIEKLTFRIAAPEEKRMEHKI